MIDEEFLKAEVMELDHLTILILWQNLATARRWWGM